MVVLTIKKQLAKLNKKIKRAGLKKTRINKKKKNLSVKITNLKVQLGLIFKEESAIENEIAKIGAREKKAPFPKKEQIEKKRWKADNERKAVEKKKWQILEKIEKKKKQIQEVDLKYQEVLKEEERLKKEREEICRKKWKEEKVSLKNAFFRLSDRKKSLGGRKNELLAQKDRLETELEKTIKGEKIVEDIIKEMETKEREISSPREKRKIEKEKRAAEDVRRNLEKQRWKLEKEKKRLSILFKSAEAEYKAGAEYREILAKEKFLKKKVKIINLKLGLPYVGEVEFGKREILPEEKKLLLGPPLPPPEKEKIKQKLKEMELLELPRSAEEKKIPVLKKEIGKRKKEKEERKKKEQECRTMLKKALDSYKKGEFSVTKKLLNKVIAAEEIKEKKPLGLLAGILRIIRGASLQERARELLKKIKKEEEKAEAERQKAEELKRKEEMGTAEIVRMEEEKKREELIKKYKEELKVQKGEITERYEKDLERQMRELKKQKEIRMEGWELERELERRKAGIKEKYEQEIEGIKKGLEKRQIKELMGWEKKLKIEETKKRREVLRKKEEELKIREAELRKKRGVPAEVLTEEEERRRKKAILEEEEEFRKKRQMIEEETKRIEEQEMMKKQLGEKGEEPVTEEAEAEKEKRRAWLRAAIKKEKMAPEEMEKEQKEKTANLETLFKEAIFHYKEKDLNRAIEIFQELKRELPEPKKEPGFFSRIFGKIPLYIQIEDYISKIEKEKILKGKRMVWEIRESARITSEEKRKVKYQLFSKLKRKISKWLPPNPLVIFKKFLFLPPLVAIDISDYSIEILRLNKKLSVLAYGRSTLKEGVIRNGEIKDLKELSTAFKLAVNQAGFKSFKPRQGPILRGIVSVPEYKTNILTFTFKSRENIFEKVKEEIKKTVPFPIDELYWDYLKYWDEKLNVTKVLSVAVSKDIIDEQIYFLKSSGVEPVIFDFEAASIGKAFLPEKAALGRAGGLILDIGARVTNINIFGEAGFINLSTAIPDGGHYLIDRMTEYFGVSKKEAETIINIKGFRKEDNIILEVLEKGMEKIVEEIKKAIKYYQKKTGNEIKKIILSGGTALLPEIDKFFQSRFQDIKIEIGDPLKKIKRRGGIDPNKAVLYANSIGLALRSITKDPIGGGINLLPGKIKEKEKKVYWQRHRQKLIIIQIILVALIAAATLLIYLYI